MGNDDKFTCYIIGDGALLIACGELIIDSGHDIYGVISSNPLIREWAEDKGIKCIGPDSDYSEFLRQKPFDYLFSIVYLSLIPKEVLTLPKKMSINFHDALLPKYAGIHATSWAIMNKETRHGITWHEMVSEADKGNILKQKTVKIENNETAFSLNMKCYEAGLESFTELLDELAADCYKLTFQDLNRRTYFGKYKRPSSGCVLSWKSSAEEMDAMVRALDFGKYQNKLGLAKIAVYGEYIIVGNLRITERKSDKVPGTIVQFSNSVLKVATISNDIEISSIMTIDGIPLPVSEFIKKYKLNSGDCLVEMDHEMGARVTFVHSEISRFEDYWVDKLLHLRSSNWSGLLPQQVEGKYSSSCSIVEITIPQELVDYTEKHNGHKFYYYLAAIGSFFFREWGTSFYALMGYEKLKEEFKGLENLFAVHVPIRLDLNGSHSFHDICDIASKELESIQKHKTYLRDVVVRSPQLHSIYSSGLGNKLPIIVEYVKDLSDSQTNLNRGDVVLVIPENGNIWRMIFREDVLTREKALLYSNRLATFLKRIAVMPKAALGQITTLADNEIRTLVYERNNTTVDYPKDKCIHELFKERVKQYPNKIAAIYRNENLTYMELEEKASRLASFLNRSGVRSGSLVGIFIERSLDMLVGLLGVLKAGGTYVPIDPIYPSERILHMIEDADLKMVLTQEKIEHNLPQSNAKTVCLDKDWEEICTNSDKSSSRKYYSYANKNVMPEDSAYVIFTSGSTGKPKGVEITHRGLTNFLCSMEKCPGFTKEDQILALTTICFDIAALELYLPLITGGQVEILPTEIARDGFQLKERIENGTATVVQATPATWEMLLEAGWNRKSPIKILCGGEALSAELAQKILDRCSEVWNVYGPTETTIWSSISRINLDEEITIGRPIANTQFYILDEYLNPVPDGATGELCIGGDGVAKGYLNRPDLTNEKFVPNPFATDVQSKIYKTGDSAKYLSDGRVVCLGRIDNQVKLRGFRIELGEIESVLETQDQVKRAVVVVKEDDTGYKKLVAFVVPERSTTPLTGKKLSEAVREFLPDYMIPASYIYLDILPLTLNLKVDRKMLASMDTSQIIENYGYKKNNHNVEIHKQDNTIKNEFIDYKEEDTLFAGYFEKDLVEIVAGVVKISKEEIDFGVPMGEYGYDSIRFTVLSKRIKDKYNITITPAQFYTYTTIQKLKEHILYAFKEQLVKYYGNDVKSEYNEQPPNTVDLAIRTSAAALEGNKFTGYPNFKRDLVEVVAGVVKISKEEIDFGVSMGEYGYDSIRFTVLSKRIKDKYDITITPAQFYTYTTINTLTDFLWNKYRNELERYYVKVSPEMKTISNDSGTEVPKERENGSDAVSTKPSVEFDSNQKHWKREPVAIIGVSGIFPQSPDLDTFWDHIVNKRDLITEIPLERWNSNNYYVKRAEESKISYAKWGGFLEDIDKFDAAFFNISPREAEQMDPQQRIFLETVWKAIENAGYKASDFSGTNTGVYVGAVSSDYWDMMLCSCLEADSYTISGNINCVIANRVSYLLNLQGASASIDTACSSSLVAIHRAVTAIQNGYCDMAIAGGVNVILNPFMHIALSTNGMLSVDGRCKTFDSQANGYVRGEGAGVLILKPLSKAVADGDNIHAVIKGSSENHGGRTNSLTAPNPNAQANLLFSAYSEAGIDPSTVTYIEAHGTGTSLGDPIEINGLQMAFEQLHKKWGMSLAESYCGLGSVKTNIGHLEAAAGVAGLLKIIVAMQKGILPGMIHFNEQNPYIDLEGSPFYIVSETQEWDRLTDRTGKRVPRRAGVSSFGFGGSNSHIVLEEYCNPRAISPVHYHSPNIFVLSAKNEDRLKAYAMDMLTYLEKLLMGKEKVERVEDAYSDIMYTLQMGRDVMNKRLAIVASDMEELIQKLRQYCAGEEEITQLYIGSIGTETKNLVTLLAGSCGKEFIETIIKQKEYKKLAHLWVSGISLDWNLLYNNPLPRRISLPTYPFAKERHWIFKSDNNFTSRSIVKATTSHSHPLLQQNTSVMDELDSKGISTVGTMILQPSWQTEDVNPEITVPDYTQQIVIFCEPDATFKEKIEADSKGVRYLILQSTHEDIDERFQAYACQAFDEIQNLLKDKPGGNVLIQLVVSTQNGQHFFSALSGLLKTAQLENPKLIGQLIEVQLGETWESIVQKLEENSKCPMDKKIQYRDGKRWVGGWRQIEEPQKVLRIPWKDKGIYLITGGTGGLGLIFSQEIVQQVKNPTIILTGRSHLNQDKQAKLKKLEELGARIEYRQVDVTDKKAVIKLIQTILEQFGRLDGIIHGAGVIRDNFIIKKTKKELQEVLAPKVSGLVNLDQASKELSLDFFILFSSVSGSLGNIGQADYAMANDFMNAYAGYRNTLVASKQRQGHTLAINWPLWKEGGMAVNEEIQKMMVRNMGMIAMSTSNGLRAFYQSLATEKEQVMVMEGVLGLLEERLLSKASSATLQPENISVTSNFTEVVYSSSLLEKLQSALTEVVSKLLKVKIEDIDINTELNEYGFDSITYIEFANKLNQEYKLAITPTVFFEYSTIQSFAGYLVEEYGSQIAPQFVVTTNVDETTSVNESKENLANKRMQSQVIRPLPLVLPKTDTTAQESIAIVGISGIFPMAKDVNELWDNLLEGKDCITEIPKSRWDWREYYGDPAKEINKTNIKWGGFIDGVEEFDPLFFGISPREAELMDPQQRLLMTYVWKVIEDAGYSAQSLSGTQTGIFVGTASCSGYSGLISQSKIAIGEYFSTGMLPSVGPNRMSYLLNFHGPSEPIETACSSSLVAIHRAVNAIENGACEMAIAGGVNTIVTPENHISLNKAGMLSEDGRCKAFSDKANGFVRSEGVGMLFLKKLKDAELDEDHIYGVIRGTAENHGGRANSLTAPNPKAQAQLLQAAYIKAGIDPRTVTYIEAHGTGTELGDPIEINGLKTAFKELYRATGDSHVTGSHCGLGSVKTNIGHLELSAGVAGVIKVLLQLKHKTLVKNLHCDKVNPYIQLIDSPFYIVQEQEEWKALQDGTGKDIPRRGGVSSFGFGGVNAHIVIEEYIPGNQESELIAINSQNPALIVLSAKNEERLKEQAQQLLGAIEEQKFVDSHLADMAYTLQVGREAMEERLAMIVGSMKELKERLKSFIEGQQHIEDLYWGQVKRNKETVAIFTADEDLEKIIDVWVAKRKYKKLLNLWVKGLSFDWNKLYDNAKPKRISLPTYPFARERYWIPNSESKETSSPVSTATFIHPLLHQNTSDFSEQRFISRFTGKEFFMDQNIVKGQRILPGMAYLEMARAAFVQSVGSLKEKETGVRLKNVVWGSPVLIKEQGLQVHIGLWPEDNGDVSYEIYSEAEKLDAESQLYSQGTAAWFSVKESPPLDIEALRAECCQDLLTSNQIYERLTAVGINYGPEHKGIEKIYIGLGQVLAKLTVPFVVNMQEQFVLHPILMDAALQAAKGLITGFSDRTMYLPFALEELEIICDPASTMWALIRYSDGNKADKVPKLDIQLFDELGKICVRMRRMEIQENTERKLLK